MPECHYCVFFLSHDAVAVAFSIQTVLASEYLTAEINAKITAAFTFFGVGSFFYKGAVSVQMET